MNNLLLKIWFHLRVAVELPQLKRKADAPKTSLPK
jgi:hypothetical protein